MKKVFQYFIVFVMMLILHYPLWLSVLETVKKWWGIFPFMAFFATGGIVSDVINKWVEKILYKDSVTHKNINQ